MTIAFHDDTKQKLPVFAIEIVMRNHKLEFILYLKAMKLIAALNERKQSNYLSLPSIRRTLSSMKIDRTMARFLLRDLCECGFISYLPSRGYGVDACFGPISCSEGELEKEPSFAIRNTRARSPILLSRMLSCSTKARPFGPHLSRIVRIIQGAVRRSTGSKAFRKISSFSSGIRQRIWRSSKPIRAALRTDS